MRTPIVMLAAAVSLLGGSVAGISVAQAQSAIQACTEEDSLQQIISSGGSINPDDCATISISSLASQGRQLCLIDLSPGTGGVLGRIQDVARSSKYWVRCADLASAAAAQQ